MIDKDNLIIKLFKGKCSREELETIFRLIEEGTLTQDSEVMEALWNQTQDYPDLNSAISKRIYNRVLSLTKMDKTSGARLINMRSRRRNFMKLAAAILVVIGLSTWFWLNNNNAGFSKTETFTTAFGEQLSIELPDGSQVKLNANSSLTFDNIWDSETDRIVFLEGEAFFEVEKTETGQKFQVITHDLTIEVLGTTFNVNSHSDLTKVYLEEGKVKLKMKELEQETIMEPGELVTYSESEKKILEKRRVMPELHTSWRTGSIMFENIAFKEVLQKMEEIYGVTIKVENQELCDTKIRTGVPIDNLETALTVLEKLLKIEIKREGDMYKVIQ